MRVDYTKYPGAAKVAKYHIAILGPGQCYRMSKKSCPTCKRFSRVPDTVNKENAKYSDGQLAYTYDSNLAET